MPETSDSAGRPRKIVDEYARIAKPFVKPTTYVQTQRFLKGEWSRHLKAERVESDDVSVHTFHSFLARLSAKGATGYRIGLFAKVRSAHVLVWNSADYAGTKWPNIAAEIDAIQLPNPIDEKVPFEPYPLTLGPKILDAARLVKQFRVGSGEEVYSEAFAVVATLLYSGGRAQFYGLKTSQALAAIREKFLETYVKGGHKVKVPIPDRLLEIWSWHLKHRDYADSPFLFRRGKDPYVYKDQDASRKLLARGLDPHVVSNSNAGSNNMAVQEILQWENQRDRDAGKDCVRRRLRELHGIDEDLTAHRFRKNVGTHYDSYGLKEDGPELRLVLSHGAKGITAKYNAKDILEVQAKVSQIDLGSVEWVEAHNPPSNLFDENAKRVEELKRQLIAAGERTRKAEERADRMEKKLDDLLARLPKVVA